jgi:putative transposase
MRDPFARLFVHLVWATWDRLPLLTPAIRPLVYRCLAAEAHRLNAQTIAIGGIEDHVCTCCFAIRPPSPFPNW